MFRGGGFSSLDQQMVENPRLSQALKTIGVDYFYDILELDNASNGRPLTCATVFLFQRMGLIKCVSDPFWNCNGIMEII